MLATATFIRWQHGISIAHFDHPLPPGALPRGLRFLHFGSRYNQPLQVGSIPDTVEVLQFGVALEACCVLAIYLHRLLTSCSLSTTTSRCCLVCCPLVYGGLNWERATSAAGKRSTTRSAEGTVLWRRSQPAALSRRHSTFRHPSSARCFL